MSCWLVGVEGLIDGFGLKISRVCRVQRLRPTVILGGSWIVITFNWSY